MRSRNLPTRSRLVRDLLTRITQTKTGSEGGAAHSDPQTDDLAQRDGVCLRDRHPHRQPADSHPLDPARASDGVDPGRRDQPRPGPRFLAAVEADGERGRHLKAFFACMYYAALRPEEATELRRSSITLPAEPGRWGEMRLTEARPRSGSSWTNTGEIRERAPLKHRAEGEARRVPIHPDLVEILHAHLAEFGPTDPRRSAVRRRPCRTGHRPHLPPCVPPRPYSRLHRRGSGLTADEGPLRPPPCRRLHLAAHHRRCRAGGPLGRPQCPGPTQGLRQGRRRHRAGVPRPHLERDTPTPRRTRLQGHK